MMIILGFSASAIVGPAAILAASTSGNSAITLLATTLGGGAGSLGGEVLLACVSAIAFATILAVVSGIMISSASTISHRHLWSTLLGIGQQGTSASRDCKDRHHRLRRRRHGSRAARQDVQCRIPRWARVRHRGEREPACDSLSMYWRRFTDRGAVAAVLAERSPRFALCSWGPRSSVRKASSSRIPRLRSGSRIPDS